MFLFKKAISTLLTGTGLSLAAVQTPAQEASAPNTSSNTEVLQEIVVTAQKRSERLVDVPLSITAASGDQLAKQGITDTAALTKLVPGFTYQQSNYGTPIFTIRGIGYQDGAYGAEPTVTTYIDQVPLPYPTMTRGATLDLERVEVLKGPQGTLFGQNSTGGAVNYIAAKPTADLSAGADVSYGRFNDRQVESFLSGPITDRLRARVAVRGEFADDWQKSITRPGDHLGDKEFYNARLLLDWTPTDALSFEFNASGWQDKSEIAAAQLQSFSPLFPPNPINQFVYDALNAAPIRLNDAREADWTPGMGHKNNKFYLLSLRGDWSASDQLTLTSITAYSHLSLQQPYDPDGAAFENFSNPSRPGLLTSFSQELRIAGDMDRWRWMLGGNFQRQVANERSTIANEATNGVLPTPTGPVYQDASAYIFDQQPTFKAAFGSLDFDLTDQLTAQVSARYTEQERHFEGCIRDPGPGAFGVSLSEAFLGLSELLSGTPSTIARDNCLTLNDVTFKPEKVFKRLDEHNVSWRASLNWKPSHDGLLYTSVAKGFKAGTFATAPGIQASEFDPIPQESVLSVEVGAKQSFGGRVYVSGAVYHYDYKDKQLLGVASYPFFGNLPKLVNIPKSRVWGAELEVTAQPIERLKTQLGVSYVNSRVKSDPQIPLDPFGNTTSYVGEAFPNTPKWQVVGDAEYAIPLSGSTQVFVGGSVSYRAKSQAAFGNHPAFELPSYTLIDLRAGLEWDKWRAQIWGHNITDKYYWLNVSHLLDTVNRNAGMPVTYGITVSYRY